MTVCDYCQTQTQKTDYCPNCGTTLYTAGGKIFYGSTAKDVSGCEVAITDKYLIIRKVSGAESKGAAVGRAFGLLGYLTAEVASQKVRPHGFYDLSIFKKGIFPYQNNGIKKKNAIKLITNDGKDFILLFDKPGFVDGTSKVIKKMVERIRTAIPMVEDGTGRHHGDHYCVNPYVTLDTFDKVKAGYTPPSPKAETPAPSRQTSEPYPPVRSHTPVTPTQPSTPITPAAPITPPQPSTPVDHVAPVQPSAPITPPVPQQKEFDTSQNAKQPKVLRRPCPNCGNFVLETNKFCNECGNKMEKEEKKCARCGAVLEEKDKFCGQCGFKVTQKEKCLRCGAKLKQDDKFCSQCGYPAN